jgi:glycosyltransferase involved in cell wall biosynthesis
LDNSPSKTGLSITIPAFNEEHNLDALLSELCLFMSSQKSLDFEVIVVNDCSTDDTLAVAEKYKNLHKEVRVISNKVNEGFGESLSIGMRHSKFDNLLWLPGDNEILISSLTHYLELIRHNKENIIIGYILNSHIRSKFRMFLSKVFSCIFTKSFLLDLEYTNGASIFPRDVYDSINIKTGGFTFQSELHIKTIYSGHDYYHVGFKIQPRKSGASKALSVKNLKNIAVTFTKLWIEIFIIDRQKYSKKGRRLN